MLNYVNTYTYTQTDKKVGNIDPRLYCEMYLS